MHGSGADSGAIKSIILLNAMQLSVFDCGREPIPQCVRTGVEAPGEALTQSTWKTSSMPAHHSPSLRVASGACMGIMMLHQS